VTYRKGDRVKVKGRRGILTVHTEFKTKADVPGWWCVAADGGRFIPAKPEQMRRVNHE